MVWNLEIANKCTIFDGHSRFPPICISWSLGVAFGSFVILDELFDDPSLLVARLFFPPAPLWCLDRRQLLRRLIALPIIPTSATEILSRPNGDMKRRKFAGWLMTGISTKIGRYYKPTADRCSHFCEAKQQQEIHSGVCRTVLLWTCQSESKSFKKP